MKKNVLVTGGAGFMGSHITEELIAMGCRVIILDDLSGGSMENIPSGAKFVKGSIVNRNSVEQIFKRNKIEYVYHLAAYAAEWLSHFIKRFNYMNNLIGSINLLNAAVNHNVKCFVFTSSIAVYGTNQLPMKENITPHPEDSYGIAKLSVEKELAISKELFGLDYVIFRPHNVYGERQNIGDKYRNVIGIFINQIMQGKPLTVFGDGKQTRAFTYIKDIAPIIARAPFKKQALNQIFNIGADTPCTINQIAEQVMRVMGQKAAITYLKERKEVKHAYSDHQKQKRVFGDKIKHSLYDGLSAMAEWAKKTRSRKSKTYKNIEIPKNLLQGDQI
ncbi:MAG: NAD-dependent epimerase/dehydratase family protein [Candidatus Omnitrophota bacterium]